MQLVKDNLIPVRLFMSDNYENLHRFFSNLGFSVERSERFGDFIIEGCSPYFCLKGVSDRLIESLEISSRSEQGNWFDMNVVMACSGEQDKLDQEVNLETDMKFVETHLDELATMFDEENYQITKVRLMEFARERAKKRWPRWFT